MESHRISKTIKEYELWIKNVVTSIRSFSLLSSAVSTAWTFILIALQSVTPVLAPVSEIRLAGSSQLEEVHEGYSIVCCQ